MYETFVLFVLFVGSSTSVMTLDSYIKSCWFLLDASLCGHFACVLFIDYYLYFHCFQLFFPLSSMLLVCMSRFFLPLSCDCLHQFLMCFTCVKLSLVYMSLCASLCLFVSSSSFTFTPLLFLVFPCSFLVPSDFLFVYFLHPLCTLCI